MMYNIGMKKTYCDLCKKETPPNYEAFLLLTATEEGEETISEEIDLCKDCCGQIFNKCFK